MTDPNTFRPGALPADPSVRQRIGAMLGERDYARFRELRETLERVREQLSSESGLATTPTIRDQGLFATASADAPTPAPHFRIWPGPLAAIFGEETRAQIARRAAVNLAAFAPLSWRINARGPDALDDLGFVRICVQAALDWNPTLRRPDWIDPITDAFLPPSAAPHRRHNPNTLAELCWAWGLQKVDLKGRRAGDVILYPMPIRFSPTTTTARGS